MQLYRFPAIAQFLDRQADLARLEQWWEADHGRGVALVGRRRVGKSWLFRAFADGKPADILVADARAERDQLAHFGGRLTDDLGTRPQLDDLASLFRLLYRRARDQRRLAVIDEFPELWQVNRELPSVLRSVIEEEASGSQLKLLLCGSQVAMMEDIFAERNALHGRFDRLEVRPLAFSDATVFLGGNTVDERITQFAVCGGMPQYLRELAGSESLAGPLVSLVLDPRGPLFDEVRGLLTQELRTPHTYFSILEALAGGPLGWSDILARSRLENSTLGKYLGTLEQLHIVEPVRPVTERSTGGRGRRYRIRDGFIRFWFRFVFPARSDLEAGLDPEALYAGQVEPGLAAHTAPVFEDLARTWARAAFGTEVRRVGVWWGPSRHDLRRSGIRSMEEIDVVGMAGSTVRLIGECRWRTDPIDVSLLSEIRDFKLPALAQQASIRVAPTVRTVLFSRTGFTDGVRAAAADDRNLVLVDPERLVGELARASELGPHGLPAASDDLSAPR